jgi:hypothetical protein
MDSPVVKAARTALREGNVNLVTIWVQKADEAETKQLISSPSIRVTRYMRSVISEKSQSF